MPTPALPKLPTGVRANAAVLKFSWNVGLERLGFPTTVILGAIAEPVIFAPSVVVKVGVKDAPVWNVDIPLMLQ